ncbi:MAG: hypothetical protein ACLRFE_03070 [Clostridia bacterium]
MIKNIVIDTNVIQALYMILYIDDGIARLRKQYNDEEINTLIKVSKNLTRFKLYITTQIYKEVVLCEVKYPGILKFVSKNCKICQPSNYDKNIKYNNHITNLQKEYLKKDIILRDKTHNHQQAISSETKNGIENLADSLIVSEKNVISGLPMYTLNEQHLICMNEAKKKSVPYRSRAILFKNKKYIKETQIEDASIKANISKETATTFKVSKIFHSDYTL